MHLHNLTIKNFHEGLLKKEFSALEVAEAYYWRITEKDPEIGAYLTLTRDLAMRQAEAADVKVAKGEQVGPLEGVPIAVKDNILIQGERVTAGSKILADYVAPYDAGVVTKLRGAGAVFLGKTNLDEFAMGASTENSGFHVTKNPHDTTRVPGGSSGGSAAAVAAHMALGALGSDTGGSIRQPAAFSGVVGLKPTYGAVSRSGLIAMASSLDQIGPITRTVEDAEILFRAIEG
ncbi:MAG: amidase, partial [Patescibacteria group bacterium]